MWEHNVVIIPKRGCDKFGKLSSTAAFNTEIGWRRWNGERWVKLQVSRGCVLWSWHTMCRSLGFIPEK